MKATIAAIKDELLLIRTLELSKKTTFMVEKILWILIALCGTVWFCFFMASQVKLWKENKIIVSNAAIDLSEINYPSVTFCSERDFKYGVAQRLGNYLNPDKKIHNQFLSWIRKATLECAISLNSEISAPICEGLINEKCASEASMLDEMCEKIENHLAEDVTFSTWDLGKAAQKFLEFQYNCKASTIHWFEGPERMNWATDNIGSWIAQHYFYLRTHCFNHDKIEYQTKLNELFKIEGEQVSLLDIAHLFSMINYESINDTSYYYPLFDTSFHKCSKSIINQKDQPILSPCIEPMQNQECLDYCKWHRNYTQNTDFKEFLTLMKFGMPQRKWTTNPVEDFEKRLATKLFGDSNIGNLRFNKSFAPLPMLCHHEDFGFTGENVDMTLPACTDFFPSPTDHGICMTSNLDLKQVLHNHEKYEPLMESNKRKKSSKIKGGSAWSQQTFVLTQDSDLLGVSRSWDYPSIKLQIHQSGDVGLLTDTYFTKHTEQITLKSNHEYYIDVMPIGSRSSDAFKSMNFEDRNCLLEDEGLENSMFKKYSQSNCIYECSTQLAKDVCQCHPWDFLHNGKHLSVPECDVFGRKCFYFSMENITKRAEELCPHCIEACEVTIYDKFITNIIDHYFEYYQIKTQFFILTMYLFKDITIYIAL